MAKKARTLIEASLREAELKLTPQRFAVLQYLSGAGGHPTAEQIANAVNRSFPLASRATIYNTLNALRDADLVREVRLEDGVARFEANIESHHHFVCRECGRLEDVSPEAFNPSPPRRLEAGHEVESVEIVLRGVCATCARSRRTIR